MLSKGDEIFEMNDEIHGAARKTQPEICVYLLKKRPLEDKTLSYKLACVDCSSHHDFALLQHSSKTTFR